MKFKIFLMLVTLTVLSVTPMIYMGKFDPMATIDNMVSSGASEIKKLKTKVPQKLTGVGASEKIQVYKWRDEKGVMQFSNTPPADGAPAEQITVNSNRNIVDAVKIPVVEKPEKEVATVVKPNPYSINGMKKVMDDARGVEQLLQQRHTDQQKMINNL